MNKIIFGLLALTVFTVEANFVITSHKTAGLEEPENTMSGMVLSLELPVQAIEFDLHVTKDKLLILSHDPVLNKQNCFPKGSDRLVVIAQTNRDELEKILCINHKLNKSYKLPRFEKILDVYLASGRTDIELNIEIKVLDKLIENAPQYEGMDHGSFHYPHQEVSDLVYKVVREKGMTSNIMFTTFSRELLLIMKKDKLAHENFRFGLLYKGTYAPIRMGALAVILGRTCYDNCWWASWREAYKWMSKHKIDAFIPNWPQIDNFLFRKGFIRWFVEKERNFQVFPWTLNTEEEWQQAREWKVDGVITDKPSTYLEWQ